MRGPRRRGEERESFQQSRAMSELEGAQTLSQSLHREADKAPGNAGPGCGHGPSNSASRSLALSLLTDGDLLKLGTKKILVVPTSGDCCEISMRQMCMKQFQLSLLCCPLRIPPVMGP